jgi:hypothetical protein
LFFSRDCADGAGPAVEAAIPAWGALPPEVAVAAPTVGAGCEVVFADGVCAALVVGLENRLEGAEAGAAAEVGAVELPPPRPEKSDGAADVAVVAPPVVAVVDAPVVAVLLAGTDGLNRLKPPPVEAPAPPNMLLLGAAEDVGAAVFPPKEKLGAALEAGCEEAGCAAGVAPRPNDGFAGVEEGVVLPRPLKRLPAGLEVCASCAPDAVAWVPPKRFGVGVEVGAALLLASAEALVFPPSLKSEGAPELPRVFPAGCPEVAPPNRLGVADEDAVAGFAPPNKDGVDPPAWLFCWPNRDAPDWAPPLAWLFWPKMLFPGGAPAGVVEGRNDVLFAAGVAVGVEPGRCVRESRGTSGMHADTHPPV